MKLDFLFLYEHIVREYESILLLKAELENRGYTCEIRQLLDRKKLKYFTYKKPEVVVASNMYNNEGLNSHVYNNVGKCNKVVNLHWEQMLSDTQEAEPWFNFDGNAKKCIQTCWGRQTQARLVQHGVPEKNAPVTGAVMMDFLRPEYEGYYLTKAELCAEFGLDENLPLWLYISSFGYASMGESEVKELSDMAGTDFTAFAEVNRTSMAETLTWFDKYLTENPYVQLVYRPHPSEWESPQLKALASKHKHFYVLFEHSVKQWITCADEIFIWMSTAIAEVYFAGKTCHILRPCHVPHEFDPVIYKDGKYVQTYDEMLKLVNTAPPFPIEKDVIEGYFDNNETPAYIRMANLLEEVHNNPPRDNPFSDGYTPRFNLLKCIALFGIHIMYALRLHPKSFRKISPAFARFAGRIYGYIEKADVSNAQIEAWQARINKYIINSGK